MLRRLASGAALVVAAVVLAGCTPPEPVETTPAATASPSQSTLSPLKLLEEDAVEVARHFLRLTDEAFSTGMVPSDELNSIATPELVAQLQAEVEAFALQGLTVEGASSLDSATLVSVSSEPPPGEPFELLACVDTSQVATTDQAGQPVSGGVTRQPRVFEFVGGEALVMRATTPPAAGTELSGCGS